MATKVNLFCNGVMRIPITMCHGIRPTAAGALSNPLPEERFDLLMRIAAEMGFQSINYD